jgi:ATP-dependent DNA helicase DinG
LIRTRRDRGIVAVLDARLTTKPYGRVFLKSLPAATRIDDFDALRAVWRGA